MSSVKSVGYWQWLAVSEERLLLHDGLIRVADMVPVPVGAMELREYDYELPVLDGKLPSELATIIRKECSTKNIAFADLLEYRYNALKGLWQAFREIETSQSQNSVGELSSTILSSSTLAGSFASRISLVLTFPMLRSLSKSDPNLSSEAAGILLQSLRTCEPLSLRNEPPDCIAGLEDMLSSWLKSAREESGSTVLVQNAASALVALGVAVGTASMLMRITHILQSLESYYHDIALLVPGVIKKLLKEFSSQEVDPALTAEMHCLGWGYDDELGSSDKDRKGSRSIAFDGQFIYVVSSSLGHLLKVGSGIRGSIRGFVYGYKEIKSCWIIFVDQQLLLFQRQEEGEKETIQCHLVDKNTLEFSALVRIVPPAEAHQTMQLMSDGTYVYWLYAVKAQEIVSSNGSSEKFKQHPVYIETLSLKTTTEEQSEQQLVTVKKRLYIHRSLSDIENNSEIKKAILRSNPSFASGGSSMMASLIGQPKDDNSPLTSMGLSIKTLRNSACYCTGSSLVILVSPPSNSGGRGGLFGSSASPSRTLFYNICFSFCSGKLTSQVDLQAVSGLHCALTQGASSESIAACFDSRNLCVWTASDDWIDLWSLAGRINVSDHHLISRLGPGRTDIESLSNFQSLHVSSVISLLLRHIGIKSCCLLPGLEFSDPVMHSLPLVFLSQCSDLLEGFVKSEIWDNAQYLTITLQAVLPTFLDSPGGKEDGLLPLINRIRIILWDCLFEHKCPSSLKAEVCRLITYNSQMFFSKHSEAKAYVDELKTLSPEMKSLSKELMISVASTMQKRFSVFHSYKELLELVKGSLLGESLTVMEKAFTLPEEQLESVTYNNPVFSPSLQCGSMLIVSYLKKLTEIIDHMQNSSSSTEDWDSNEELTAVRCELFTLCEELQVFDVCEQTLEELSKLVSCFPPLSSEGVSDSSLEDTPLLCQNRLTAIERVVKSSVLGCVLQPLLVVISNPEVCTLQLATTLQQRLSKLSQLTAQVCSSLYGSESLELKVPCPWASGRTLETIHPVKDNYKFKETVTFPGAINLYLKFDPRCSSQYDYDKVIVHAGSSPSCPKVAEYGGNTHGFGSRSVLGKGWPKEFVKVDGDSVTITFEMKSGREHSTPDKAMWGFACTVRPQESAEDSSIGLPFIADLYLSLITVCCSLIGRLYSGPKPNEHENSCRDLLKNELLQRCIWSVEHGSPSNLPLEPSDFPFSSASPHTSLPPVVVSKLRKAGNKPRPPMRPSHQSLLNPDIIEEAIVCACFKQYDIPSPLELIGNEQQLSTHSVLLESVFNKINGLERRLQALAELESNWWLEVEDMSQNDSVIEPFFFSLLQNENSMKSFMLLCVLKKVEVNHNDLFSTAKHLQDLLEIDVEKLRSCSGKVSDSTPVTRLLVKGIKERAELLLNVTIPHDRPTLVPGGSAISGGELLSHGATYFRSISAPPSTVDTTLRKQKSWGSNSSKEQALLDVVTDSNPTTMLDQIFQFIGSKPEEAISCSSFLSAAGQHWRRGVCRVRALGHLQQLITSDYIGVAVSQLLALAGLVLQKGPGIEDIACGGMASQVREVFGSVMQAVVQLASKKPASCINTIAMLCVVPYTRQDEECLVRSGLVKMLDHLCSLVDNHKPLEIGGATDDSIHRVTSLAWASFRVLAEQCVSWESQHTTTLSTGLARQVSHLLTNHLSRAMDCLVLSEGGASESLQDALSLLLGLSESHMGRAILSQPACISKLLLLLTDTRPSPKLVLIALQLCRIALPLMTVSDCSKVDVPQHLFTDSVKSKTDSGVAGQIVGLFLSKLAEYIVPNSSPVAGNRYTPYEEHADDGEAEQTPSTPKEEDFEPEAGQCSVYVYKRKNENATDILQPLISQDPRQFRLAGGNRMQEVMAMDRALSQNGVAEIITDSYRGCVRRGLRWANMGFTVSVGPPSGGTTGEVSGAAVDKKKTQSESAARKKNIFLLKTEPPRAFVSGHVAYSLASEVIGLLNGLLTEPGAAQVWGKAIKKSMLQSLQTVPELAPKLAEYASSVVNTLAKGGETVPPAELLSSACLANATFAALGGFKESIRPGLKVEVVGDGLEGAYGIIQSISERRGLAHVQFNEDHLCFGIKKTLEVPIARLLPPHKETLPIDQLGIEKELCQAILSLLKTNYPIPSHASASVDANTTPLGLCRLFAEMRTRSFVALSQHVQQESFSSIFINEDSFAFEKFCMLARNSSPVLRLSLVEQHCQSLRMLYRDCSRPAPPKQRNVRTEPKQFILDITKVWPPVTSCLFTSNLTCVVYQGPSGFTPHAPAALSSGEAQPAAQPKGVVIYTDTALPKLAPSFYWELEVTHLGESSADTAHLAMGYSPAPCPSDSEQWSYPVGSCFIRSSGRGCHVTSDNSMEWKTFRFNNPLKNGDIVGCGWLQNDDTGTGNVYFTLNGEKQGSEFSGTPSAMFPFLHMQKKGIRLRVNFGDRKFSYAPGQAHREAANIIEEGESLEVLMANFEALPFSVASDDEAEIEAEATEATDSVKTSTTVVQLVHNGPPTRKLKPPIATVGYDHESSLSYHSVSSFDSMLESGPLVRPGGGVTESSDVEEEDGLSVGQEQDLHVLLVKAWETKVFPVIQRRFRNDQERKSGLEQIRGALQLGMESIAQETVEFLYEENGGIPKDLQLPTMDDVKAELGKFTVSRIKKGSAVVVQRELPYSRCGVRSMQKTQGLTGIVLDIDHANEVIQVECYLQSEGALVRFWYPVVYLERPPPGYRKSSALRGADAANILVHRELLQCEMSLAGLYCRRALLRLKKNVESTIQDIVDHLNLVNAECFAEPLSDGLCASTCPDIALSPSSALNTITLSPLSTFYSDIDRMTKEICQAIKWSSEDLILLAKDLCECLQRTPDSFGSLDLKVTESKEAFDVAYPDAAFMVVSCIDDPSVSSCPASSTYKYPWARILCYRGGSGRVGSQQMQEVVRYPNEITQSSSNQYCGPTYPSLVLPFSRIHIKVGGCSTKPGKVLNILSLPAGFPLALGFAEQLSLQTIDIFEKGESAKDLLIHREALSICLESMSKVVTRLNCPQPLKILLLCQMANVMHTLCWTSREPDSQKELYCFSSEFLQSAHKELIKVYESDIKSFSSKNKSMSFPPAGSVGTHESGKFSTFFQSLLEFVVMANKYQEQFHGLKVIQLGAIKSQPTVAMTESAPLISRSTSSEAGASAAEAPVPSLSDLTRKKKKLHPRKRTSQKDFPGDLSENQNWLSQVNSAIRSLVNVIREEPRVCLGREASLAQQWNTTPASRIIIVTGIDCGLNVEVVRSAIQKLCNVFGGLYRDQLFLPTKTPVKDPLEDAILDASEKNMSSTPALQLLGYAVLELCCSAQVSAVSAALLSCPSLKSEESSVQVCTVSNYLKCGDDKEAEFSFLNFLSWKLLENDCLRESVKQALKQIVEVSSSNLLEFPKPDVVNDLKNFLAAIAKDCDISFENLIKELLKFCRVPDELLVDELVSWVYSRAKTVNGARPVWLGLLACGYDFHLDRYGFFTHDKLLCQPSPALDCALVNHVDSLCRSLAVTVSSIEPWDITLSEADIASHQLSPLQSVSLRDIRFRFLQLKLLNNQITPLFAIINLRSDHPLSLGHMLSQVTPLLFYDRKIAIFHAILNASTRRKPDQAPPEIKMDPLESVSGLPSSPLLTHYCQAAQQLLSIPSAQLCIPLASGGDPTYAFNVKLSGEEVQGNSGSFRHFLWQVVRELQSSLLPILSPCPSGASGINHGYYILANGPMTFSIEKLLHFFGQLLGVAIRADMPVSLDLLPCFWKSLKRDPLILSDLKEADCVTYNLTNKILHCSSAEEFEELVAGLHHGRVTDETDSSTSESATGLYFVYPGLDGIQVELCPGGRQKRVEFSSRVEFCSRVRELRLKELACVERVTAIKCGLATVIPLELLDLLSADDLSLRICGLPHVNLEYLKRHTMYQVGLMETDRHVQYFWSALESFSQDELRKFIKFACNQERIPFGHPCRDGPAYQTLHVPPYPMKIAPPDGQGPPDARYIRAETCMFMIKLPQYSSQDIMTERLKYAINCREDPLSG